MKPKSATECCMTSLASIERGLVMADCQVEAAKRHLVLQTEIVRALEEGGREVRVARNVLATFEDLYFLHVNNRRRLREMKTQAETIVLHRLLMDHRIRRLERRSWPTR